MTEQEAVEKVSQLWCLPKTSHIVMEPDLANAMVQLLLSVRRKAITDCIANAMVAEREKPGDGGK